MEVKIGIVDECGENVKRDCQWLSGRSVWREEKPIAVGWEEEAGQK